MSKASPNPPPVYAGGSVTPDATSTLAGKVQLTHDLGGTASAPQVVGLTESGGTDLPLGAIADGQVLTRSGAGIVGADPTTFIGSGSQILPGFGTGGDGDVTIAANTTLTQSQNYRNL